MFTNRFENKPARINTPAKKRRNEICTIVCFFGRISAFITSIFSLAFGVFIAERNSCESKKWRGDKKGNKGKRQIERRKIIGFLVCRRFFSYCCAGIILIWTEDYEGKELGFWNIHGGSAPHGQHGHEESNFLLQWSGSDFKQVFQVVHVMLNSDASIKPLTSPLFHIQWLEIRLPTTQPHNLCTIHNQVRQNEMSPISYHGASLNAGR